MGWGTDASPLSALSSAELTLRTAKHGRSSGAGFLTPGHSARSGSGGYGLRHGRSSGAVFLTPVTPHDPGLVVTDYGMAAARVLSS
jgi:hypothetical protein